jgi:hypothetical protein
MQVSPLQPAPATGGVLYYPAERRGTFPSVRAALASIGCTGDHAAVQIANAEAEGSPSVAVPVTLAGYPGDEFLALVVRKPGGKAVLWLGLLEVADEDEELVKDAARQFSEASRRPFVVFQWVRQARAVQ